MVDQETLAALRQELRRGSLVLLCLLALRHPDYGYSLLSKLEESGVTVEANTLYPLLRRLERQGLVTADWVTDDPRPRKYYRTSEAGQEVADLLSADWRAISGSLEVFEQGSER